MSGGYFNYLCDKDGAGLLGDQTRDDLLAMALMLQMRPDGAEVADATFAALQDARESLLRLQSHIDQLHGVWKALEWKCSGDWGDEQVCEAISDYRARLQAGGVPVSGHKQ
jgi:hypothetical protein